MPLRTRVASGCIQNIVVLVTALVAEILIEFIARKFKLLLVVI